MTGLEFNDRVSAIPVYPAASTYAFDGDLVKLASNETPFPPHPQVLEAVESQLRTLNRYPDPAKSTLRRRLSERTGVAEGRIAIGNGSCELLLAGAEAMLEPGAEVVYAWPAFSIYPHLAAMTGGRAVEVRLNDAQEHDLEAMAKEVTAATRMVIVCNPNNPTSTALPLSEIAAFVADVPRAVCVVLDEAYCEFNLLDDPDASVGLLDRHANLVLLRTFSKVYGMAAFRVGFALCASEEFPTAVDQVRQPFFCNVAAQAAATEALRHQDEVARRVERAVAGRMQLIGGLESIGLKVADSQANFVWVHLPEDADEAEVMRGVTERGVLIRAGGALGRENALRVTAGTEDENERFLRALRHHL